MTTVQANMKLSRTIVIIPAYNPNIQDLSATLSSVQSQSVGVDICIIDDGSEPEISTPSSDNITVLRLNKNAGITAALRAGVEYALAMNYEFIARLDVGDISHPDRTHIQETWMEQHPDTDILGARSRILDLHGNHLYDFGVCGRLAIRDYLFKNSTFRHSTFVIRSSSVRRLGNYSEQFPLAQDYEMLLRYSRLGVVDCIEEPLIDYIEDPSGLTAKRRKRQLSMRLKAQILHRQPMSMKWYMGILRTLVTISLPFPVAKYVTRFQARIASVSENL